MRALFAVLLSAVLVAAYDRPKNVAESMREYCRHVAIVICARYCFLIVVFPGAERRKQGSTTQEVLDSETCTGTIVRWTNRTLLNRLTIENSWVDHAQQIAEISTPATAIDSFCHGIPTSSKLATQ